MSIHGPDNASSDAQSGLEVPPSLNMEPTNHHSDSDEVRGTTQEDSQPVSSVTSVPPVPDVQISSVVKVALFAFCGQ